MNCPNIAAIHDAGSEGEVDSPESFAKSMPYSFARGASNLRAPAQPVIPDTPAGRTFKAWLDAFNSGDRARVESYIQKVDPTRPVDNVMNLRNRTGGFELLGIEKSERTSGPTWIAGWIRMARMPRRDCAAMGEQLFRIFGVTGATDDVARAIKVLHTQLWDVLTRHNLAYTSYMTYLEPGYSAQAAHNDRKVRRDSEGAIRCGERDASCWNHLGYEGYAMFNIQQLTRDIPTARFPVPGTKDDIARAVRVTMDAWHGSRFGDATRFDWSGKDSATHVLAYNCAMRFSADPAFDRQCREGLRHRNSSATLFYSLAPESLFRAGAR